MTLNPSVTTGVLLAFTMAAPAIVHAEGNRNFDKLDQLQEGVSTRNDALKLLGKPMMDHKMEGCSMCTWSNGDQMVTCMFSKDGTLQDKKEWKPFAGFARPGGR